MSSFIGSWTFFSANVLVSFIALFRYAYIFSVFQEIKSKEKGKTPIPAQPAIEPAETFE